MKSCAFDGCGKPARSAGFCNGHYRQHRMGETLRPLQVQYHGLPEFERFMKRVDKDGPDGCWIWTGSRQRAQWHGQWRGPKGTPELAHRAAWRLMRCEIPQGMCVCHRCDNPVCVNPAHLFLGTVSENFKDMWAKGRARPKTHCGEAHGMAKLTADKVREIRASDESAKDIAARLGVGTTTIYDVRKRKIWQHVT